jgi:hypothetical protein
MEWQSRPYQELMSEWPHTAMTILISEVVKAMKDSSRKSQGDELIAMDPHTVTAPSDVLTELESRSERPGTSGGMEEG